MGLNRKSRNFVSNSANITKPELLKLLNLHNGSKRAVGRSLGVSDKVIARLCDEYNILTNKEWSTLIHSSLKNILSNYKPPKFKIKKKKSKGATIVINFSDWHVSKIIKDDKGNIIYNLPIYKQRVKKCIKEILNLIHRHIKSHLDVEEVVILLTGDMANGENIYPTQSYEQTKSPPFQVLLVVKALIDVITNIIALNVPVKVFGVKGNHGRTGQDADPTSNWDIMIYLMLQFYYQQAKEVSVLFSEGDYYEIKIRTWNYLLRHRAYVQDETAAGDAKYKGWKLIHDSDVIVSAHYHHWSMNGRQITNGALCGGDDLSENMAKCENNPAQLIWVVTNSQKVTNIFPVRFI